MILIVMLLYTYLHDRKFCEYLSMKTMYCWISLNKKCLSGYLYNPDPVLYWIPCYNRACYIGFHVITERVVLDSMLQQRVLYWIPCQNRACYIGFHVIIERVILYLECTWFVQCLFYCFSYQIVNVWCLLDFYFLLIMNDKSIRI